MKNRQKSTDLRAKPRAEQLMLFMMNLNVWKGIGFLQMKSCVLFGFLCETISQLLFLVGCGRCANKAQWKMYFGSKRFIRFISLIITVSNWAVVTLRPMNSEFSQWKCSWTKTFQLCIYTNYDESAVFLNYSLVETKPKNWPMQTGAFKTSTLNSLWTIAWRCIISLFCTETWFQ